MDISVSEEHVAIINCICLIFEIQRERKTKLLSTRCYKYIGTNIFEVYIGIKKVIILQGLLLTQYQVTCPIILHYRVHNVFVLECHKIMGS